MKKFDPVKKSEHGTLRDAQLLTPLDLHAPELQQEVVISVGSNFQSKKWKNDRMSIAKLIAILATHPEGKQKDGPGFVLAEIIGDNRKKHAVSHCYAVGLDIDVGMPGAEIDELLKQFGYLAVRYTTFSHGKTTSKLNKDKIVQWCDQEGLEFGKPSVQRFLREKTKWNETILATAEYTGDQHEATGLMACISHAPMEKHRIVVPLAEPFSPSKVTKLHAQGMTMWAEVCRALARRLGNLPMDNAATDPSRLFYFPRHGEGRPHETTIVGGPLLDWRTLVDPAGGSEAEVEGDEFDRALAAEIKQNEKSSPRSKSMTDEGRKLGRWATTAAQGFQIVDVIRDHADDRIRTPGGIKIDIECPFDEDHSNPGDPADRACFAVNAGDDQSDIFTIRCAHDSCQGKTNLDFLGKMLKDDWFSEEVLNDDQYNPEVEESAPSPIGDRRQIDRLNAQIDALGKPGDARPLDTIVNEIAKLDDYDADDALQRLKSVTGRTLGFLNAQLSKARKRDVGQGRTYMAEGKSVFQYDGALHVDASEAHVISTLQRANEAPFGNGQRTPYFSATLGEPVALAFDKGRPMFVALTKGAFKDRVNARVAFQNGNGEREYARVGVADTVFAQIADHLPSTPELIFTPIFADDGTLIEAPGWYEDAGLLLAEGGIQLPRVSPRPTNEEVAEAVKLLKVDLLGEFPFRDVIDENGEAREVKNGTSLTNAMSMVITPFARRLFHGPSPIFFITKPEPGTGGSLLGELPARIFDGRAADPVDSDCDEAELQKTLVAAVLERRSTLFFDDVKHLNFKVIHRWTTADEIGGRILGHSKTATAVNRFNWIATGNNPNVGQETARRCVWINLNAKLTAEQVATRTFKKNLRAEVAERRHEFVWAILTLIQAWLADGVRMKGKATMPSFDNWAEVVGGILARAGVDGFLANKRSLLIDDDVAAKREFVRAWWKAKVAGKVKLRTLIEWAVDNELDVAQGRFEPQKRASVKRALDSSVGQVFSVEDALQVIVRRCDLDGDIAFHLEALEAADG